MRDPGLDPREHRQALLVLAGVTLIGCCAWAYVFWLALTAGVK